MHGHVLRDRELVLRPLTERDWALLYRWNRDPDLLYFMEGQRRAPFTLMELQELYRSVSQHAYCFIIKTQGREIGDCWLQEMNVDRIIQRHPSKDCRRIDIAIGDAAHRGRGIGARAILLLAAFAFHGENADRVYGLVGQHNPRSRRAFENSGFELETTSDEPIGPESGPTLELVLSRQSFLGAVPHG